MTGVTWTPYYDLHASTSDGKPASNVSLHYCANITQNTGEDWNNTTLTLSTANSQALRSLSVPKVDPLRLLPAVGQSVFGHVNNNANTADYDALRKEILSSAGYEEFERSIEREVAGSSNHTAEY